MKNYERGFTLMEILLTMVILSMLATITASSLQIAIQTWSKGEERVEKIEQSRHLLDFIAEDIRAAFPFRTIVDNSNVSAFFGDPDRINFVTTTPLINAQSMGTGLREVSYWAESGKGLLLREAPLLHTDLYSDDRGIVMEVAPNVQSIHFQYLYQTYSRTSWEIENIWSDSWGSIEELSSSTGIGARMSFQDENIRLRSLRYLPSAIKITLSLSQEDKDGRSVVEELEPIIVPIMQAQLYEAPRQ